MGRRHLVLGVGLAASIATSGSGPPPLFSGKQSLEVEPFWLDEARPTRSWIITTSVVLPAEATLEEFTSVTTVRARPTDSEASVALLFGECGGPVENGTPEGWATVEDAFVDCLTRQPCIRMFCVEIAGVDALPVEVAWSTWTVIDSDAWVDDWADSVPVPIDIAIEELEP